MSVVAAFAVPHPPILLPEIGRGEEKKIQKTADAYRTAMSRIAALRPDTVVLTSPHAVMYSNYFHISPGTIGMRGYGSIRRKKPAGLGRIRRAARQSHRRPCEERRRSRGSVGRAG